MRPTAKRARFLNTDHSESRNPRNSEIFQHPANGRAPTTDIEHADDQSSRTAREVA